MRRIEKFDYKTGDVNESNIFDTTTTGSSFYNDLIPGDPENEYMEKNKNLKGEIKMVSPYEYFKGCSKIFGTTVEKLKLQTEHHGNVYDTLDELADVITKEKKQYPMTYLNFAQGG